LIFENSKNIEISGGYTMKDKFLVAMNEMLDRWEKVGEERTFCGKKVKFLPRLVSITFKHEDYVIITSVDGGLTSSPTACFHQDASLRVRTAIGDDNGVGIDTHHAFAPSQSINGLKQKIDKMLDESYKEALADYFGHHRTISRHQGRWLFKKLSLEEPVSYKEKEEQFNLDTEELSLWIEQAAKLLQNLEEVETSEVESELRRENRRLVRFERLNGKQLRSNIFTSQVWGEVKFVVKMRDANGRLIPYTGRLASVNFKDFTKENILAAAERLAKTVKEMTGAKVQESDSYRAVLLPKALGVRLHEGFAGHKLSGRYIYERKATTFTPEKIGKKILPSFITIWDDPTLQKGFGSYKFDEEGVSAQKTLVVENGILRSFLHDRISAGREGVKSNGKSRSEKTREPEPRVTNLVVESSKSYSINELISMMIEDLKKNGEEYGLLIEGGGGDVYIETPEHREYPITIHRIYADGRREPVTSVNIYQEAYESLKNIVAVGKKKEVFYGFCGAESGDIPIQMVCPAAYVKSVEVETLGGKIPRERLLKKLEPEEDDDYEDDD